MYVYDHKAGILIASKSTKAKKRVKNLIWSGRIPKYVVSVPQIRLDWDKKVQKAELLCVF